MEYLQIGALWIALGITNIITALRFITLNRELQKFDRHRKKVNDLIADEMRIINNAATMPAVDIV